MKYVLFLAGVVLVQIIGAYGNKDNFKECAKELKITPEMMKEGWEKNQGKPEFRCLNACLMKKDGMLEAGNKMNFDKMKPFASKIFGDNADKILKAKQECAEKSKGIADECDFIQAVDKCTLEKVPDLKKMFKLKKNA